MHEPGTCIGSYRLVRLLGEGAMGAVHEAEHTVIERRAAIKLLHSDVLELRSSVQRFLNEARAINRVRHPGLVEIFEFGELPDGAPYLVMELLGGETLSARSAHTKRWQPALALDIARQVADAMTAAHSHGIVHRDLKPSDVATARRRSRHRSEPTAKCLQPNEDGRGTMLGLHSGHWCALSSIKTVPPCFRRESVRRQPPILRGRRW